MYNASAWECVALDGQRVAHGENFVPGPDYCTACKCEKGEAKFCRAALCQPIENCKSYRTGESCCDFICLDDILPTLPDEGGVGDLPTDIGLRMVASSITAILSLGLLLFLIHRLRQRKLRTAQHQYFEDSLDGAHGDSGQNHVCCRNSLYHASNEHVDLFLDSVQPCDLAWKRLHGIPYEAPPPYSHAIASDPFIVRAVDAGPASPMAGISSIAVRPTAIGEENARRHEQVILNTGVPTGQYLTQDSNAAFTLSSVIRPPPYEECQSSISTVSHATRASTSQQQVNSFKNLDSPGSHINSDGTSAAVPRDMRSIMPAICRVLPQPSPLPMIGSIDEEREGPSHDSIPTNVVDGDGTHSEHSTVEDVAAVRHGDSGGRNKDGKDELGPSSVKNTGEQEKAEGDI